MNRTTTSTFKNNFFQRKNVFKCHVLALSELCIWFVENLTFMLSTPCLRDLGWGTVRNLIGQNSSIPLLERWVSAQTAVLGTQMNE